MKKKARHSAGFEPMICWGGMYSTTVLQPLPSFNWILAPQSLLYHRHHHLHRRLSPFLCFRKPQKSNKRQPSNKLLKWSHIHLLHFASPKAEGFTGILIFSEAAALVRETAPPGKSRLNKCTAIFLLFRPICISSIIWNEENEARCCCCSCCCCCCCCCFRCCCCCCCWATNILFYSEQHNIVSNVSNESCFENRFGDFWTLITLSVVKDCLAFEEFADEQFMACLQIDTSCKY